MLTGFFKFEQLQPFIFHLTTILSTLQVSDVFIVSEADLMGVLVSDAQSLDAGFDPFAFAKDSVEIKSCEFPTSSASPDCSSCAATVAPAAADRTTTAS